MILDATAIFNAVKISELLTKLIRRKMPFESVSVLHSWNPFLKKGLC